MSGGLEPTSFILQIRGLSCRVTARPMFMRKLKAEPKTLDGWPSAQCNKMTTSSLCFVAAKFLRCTSSLKQ